VGTLLTVTWVALGLLAAILLLAALLLVAWLRVEGRFSGHLDVQRLGEASAYGRVRVAPLAVVVDTAEGVLIVKLAGLRIVRKPLAELGSARAGRERAEQERRPAKPARHLRLSDGSAAWRFYRRQLGYLAARTQLDTLEADLRVATPDPALTGMLYGAGCAAVYPLRARWPRAALAVEADFVDTAPAVRLALALRVRIATLVVVAVRSYWFHRSRARKSPGAADGRRHP
jgi:hypothetical protein